MGQGRVLICRGVPGSGKSTLTHWLAQLAAGPDAQSWVEDSVTYYGILGSRIDVAIHSTDQYFVNEQGEYHYNASKIGLNHSKNYKAFKDSVEKGIPLVIVDNTNTTSSEFDKYRKHAESLDYWVTFMVQPHPTVGEAAERNVHQVPSDVIKKMIARFE